MNSSVHIDNKNKDILIPGEGTIQELDDSTSTAETKYPITFTESGKRIVLSLHYNESHSFLFVNATKVYQFKAKDSGIKDYTLPLRNISKDSTINNMKKKKKTGLKGSTKLFSVDFNPTDTNNILDIHTFLMKGICYKKMLAII